MRIAAVGQREPRACIRLVLPITRTPATRPTPPLHPSTKVPAGTLINTRIQPEGVTIKIVSFRKASPPFKRSVSW